MWNTGLQVLVTRDDWHSRGTDARPEEVSSRLLSPKQFALLNTLPTRDLQPPGDSGVKKVAHQNAGGNGIVVELPSLDDIRRNEQFVGPLTGMALQG